MVRRWVLRGCKKMRKEGPASMLSLLTAQDYAMAICSGSYPYLCLLFQLTHILYYSSLFYHLTVPTLVHTQVSVVISPIYVHQFNHHDIRPHMSICDDSSIVDHDHDIIGWSIQDIQVPHLPSHLGRLPLKISEPMRSMTPTPAVGAGPKCYGSPILWKKSWNW